MLDQDLNAFPVDSTPQPEPAPSEAATQIPSAEQQETAPAPERPKHEGMIPKHRFNEVYARQKELERQNAQLLEALTKGQPRQEVPQTEAPPDINNYTDQAEYLRAVARYEGEQAADARFQKLTESQKAQAEKDAEAERFYKAQVAFSRVSGLEEALEATAHIRYPKEHQLLVMESDVPKELTLYLANHLQEAERIASLPYGAAAREIGRIEGTIKASAGNTVPAPKVSKMVPPVSPVGAGKHQPGARSPDETIEQMTARLFPIG